MQSFIANCNIENNCHWLIIADMSHRDGLCKGKVPKTVSNFGKKPLKMGLSEKPLEILCLTGYDVILRVGG